MDDDASIKGRKSVETSSSSPTTSVFATLSSGKLTGLVRTAFPCLQLICTDFLSLLSPACLRQCIGTLAAFGSQTEDLNISLTAIGLLWNVSDFIQTRRQELEDKSSLASEEHDIPSNAMTEEENVSMIGDELTPRSMNALWVLLLMHLSTVCSDFRPEVRNGANQTLFRTIDMNGAVLKMHIWHTCLWRVLFPLIDSIKLDLSKPSKLCNRRAALDHRCRYPARFGRLYGPPFSQHGRQAMG